MISDTILHKYLRQFRLMDGTRFYHIDAIELAFRLALDELEQSIPSTPSTSSTELVALQANQLADLQAELERLQTATNAEVAELRQQIAQMDADNAAMIRRNRELVVALDIATGAAPATAKPVAILTNGHTNGAQHPISNLQSTMWDDPNILTTLDDEATDWWIGVAAGRHTWRTVPKRNQLRMVRHILSFGPETGAMTMRDFDAIKPDWMPGAKSHTQTLNLSWQQLNDWSVEL